MQEAESECGAREFILVVIATFNVRRLWAGLDDTRIYMKVSSCICICICIVISEGDTQRATSMPVEPVYRRNCIRLARKNK